MTGRTSAPDNVAYDDYGREFVFRQPANAAELAAIMSADSEEVFACYRFDGLERWTRLGVDAWLEDLNVVQGWIQFVESSCEESEIAHPLTRYAEYLDSDAFRTYVTALKALLSGAR